MKRATVFAAAAVAFVISAFGAETETSVSFYSPSIVRIVRAERGQSLAKPWKAVLAKEDKTVSVERTESEKETVWKTSALVVSQAKESGLFTFLSPDGKVLLSEKGKTSVSPAAQAFALGEEAPLYGLGDLQKPVLDIRGISHRLMPQNQGDGIAYVASPLGWALYWDDSSPVAFASSKDGFSFTSESAAFVDYYFIAGGSMDACVAGMRQLTGPSPMLPRWVYGFWQSRERYKTQDEIVSVLKRYRTDGIPLDGIVQDWQYWGDNAHWNDMKFDSRTFPDPKKMVDDIHALHAKVLITVWPSFGPKTDAFKELDSKGLLIPVTTWPAWVSEEDHSPSGAHIQDSYSPVANEIYWKHLLRLVDIGIDGWWMDSTDPDHFEKKGDLELPTSLGLPWRAVRSAYPLACTEPVATRLRKRDDRRPFILTRGASAGQQRCSTSVWSGDVESSWDGFSYQIPGGINYSLTGNPQFGCDLGGFFSGSWLPKGGVDNPEWRELYVRWFEAGVYMPMMRSHGTGVPREIYLYGKPGEEVYDALLGAIKRRYALMPYIYSTAADVSRNGTSFMRPLAADFPSDRRAWTLAQEYMFGRSLLVAPVTTPGGKVSVYLPEGTDWWDVASGKRLRGGYAADLVVPLASTPCYAKAGTIMPLGPDVQWNGEKAWDDLEVVVYPGADGKFTLYEDDFETRACERGEFTEVDFIWDDARWTLKIGARRGSYPGMLAKRRFRIRVADGSVPGVREVEYTGKAVEADFAKSYCEVLGDGWEFSYGGTGEWQKVSVPHDWAISRPFDFHADPQNDGNGNTGALPWVGKGVYRRTLRLPAEWARGTCAALEFDGVMSRPEVYLDGKKIGGWNYGYLGFRVELANVAKFGVDQELVVKCDTTRQRSRWYPGAGIYREVRLVADDFDKRALPGSVFITTPVVTKEKAVVKVEWETPAGPDSTTFEIAKPRLWDIDDPHLYEFELFGRKYRYGIRIIEWKDDGFFLNGRRVALKGVDLHSDLGPLGMAFDKSAARRQLEIMQDMGVNAFRTSHNPPDPKMLDLCDEMGILVWDECFDKWDATSGRTPDENLEGFVLGNLNAFVRRDRNHPSVIAWSIGNEISPAWKGNWYGAACDDGTTRERVKLFADAVRSIDSTRPVAMGCCFTDAVGLGHLQDLDLTGWNYRALYRIMRAKYPDKPTLYSEAAASLSTFGYYEPDLPSVKHHYGSTGQTDVTSYDMGAEDWSDIPDVDLDRERTDKYLCGQFIWSGIDYLGEPCVNWGKNRSSLFGICDLTALPKDRYYLYRSVWNDKDETIHIVPHWTWPGREGKNVPVFCYSSGDRAELFVNGKSMGVREKGKRQGEGYFAVTDDYRFRWLEVPYEPGEIKVVVWKGGKKLGEKIVRTAGPAKRLSLECEKRSEAPGSLRFVKVEAVDRKGRVVPDASHKVRFTIKGGDIVAIGNGSNSSVEPFQGTNEHSLFHSRALVYVRPHEGETCVLKAEAEGLSGDIVKLSRPAVNPITPEGVFFSDPAPRVGPDGKLWLFGSRDVAPDRYCSHANDAFETSDMKSWKVHRDIVRSKGEGREVPFLDWELLAPDGIFLDGKWHLFYCMFNEEHAEGVLDAPDAAGPYTGARELKGPTQIDPSVFRDDDGTIYYTWGQFSMSMAVLKPDFSGIVEGSIHTNVIDEARHHFHEGSQLTKRNGIYYLTFADISRKGRPTSIGYATAKSPFGPYTYRGVIVDNAGCDPETWNNHGGIAEFNGQWYVFYHRSTNGSRSMRKACVEPIEFDGDGLIKEVEMTSSGAAWGLSPFGETPARIACKMTGNARIVLTRDGKERLGGIRAGDTATWRWFVECARPIRSLSLKVFPRAGGRIALLSPKGDEAGSVQVPKGDGVESVEVGMDLPEMFGTIDAVVLRFDGEKGSDLFDLQSFTFH
jgi:alpha-D-xyloside xylohydrolase